MVAKDSCRIAGQYQKDQKELQEFLGDAYNNYNLVIALENGNPVESRIVRDRFQKLCEQNGYEKVVFHSLRHLSTGYKLKMTNGDVKSVQGDTGHAEAEMVTDVYSEIIDEKWGSSARKQRLIRQWYGAFTAFKITYARDESNAFETISFKVIFQKC